MHHSTIRLWRCSLGLAMLVVGVPVTAQTADLSTNGPPVSEGASIEQLAKLPFEELMQQPVTTVARKEERLSEVPAAIEVIPQDDLRRYGALTIPDALRLAPGLDVARIDGHRHAISSRGFNDEFANKLLVLMDGRSIYTPLFGGVYWDQQHAMIEDIERIEVIRGPGGTLWGPNAMNGIISIVRKSAKDTQGTLLSGASGSEQHWYGAARYGGRVGTNLFYRVYGTTFEQDDLAGGDRGNGWRNNQGGYRLDWNPSPGDTFTFQGDYYQGDGMETLRVLTPLGPNTLSLITRNNAVEYSGGNLLGRWTHNFQNGSQSRLQLYYDHTERSDEVWTGGLVQNTYDLDFDHRFQIGERNEMVWGVGNRVNTDRKKPELPSMFEPKHRTLNFFTGFVQDEFRVVPDRLSLFAGSKIEHNNFTGWEFQPSGRLVWTATQRQTVWAAVTRAVRTPTRVDNDLRSVVAPLILAPGIPVTSVSGSPDVKSEVEYAYELGYRVQPTKRLALDLAGFYNQYDRLVSFRPVGIDFTARPPVVSLLTQNNFAGETYGGEIAAQWQVLDWWRLRPSYSLLKVDLRPRHGSTDTAPTQQEGGSPQQQFSLRSEMDLPKHFELDASVHWVDQLKGMDVNSYTVVNLRLGWRPTPNVELSVVGQNLIDPRHAEFRAVNAPARIPEVERSIYAKATFRF